MNQENFIENYLEYQKDTEAPIIYHRWCAISGISALLGRQCYLRHGQYTIYPNQYIMIVGESGTRKDTAIKGVRKLLRAVGYNKMVADKTSKEKFLLDLMTGIDKSKEEDEIMDVNKNNKNPTMRALFGLELSTEPADCFINVGEFNAFLGHGNIEFIDLLTNLWDYEGVYENRIKNGQSVKINNPTINIIGGNTNIGISMSFPTEVIGQGFFSRLIMIFAEPSGKRIPFPTIPDPALSNKLITQLMQIKTEIVGELLLHPAAEKALAEIYYNWKDLNDVRFKSYSTRRFTHLLKLCMVCSAAKFEKTISSDTVVYANSILHYAEHFMPKAIGEFGKARNSDVTAKILDLLEKTDKPLDINKDIWPQVRRDLESRKQLGEILQGLQLGGKLQQVGTGLLPKKEVVTFDFDHCNVGLLAEYLDNQSRQGLPL